MSSERRWGAYDSITTLLTTELNSLADDGLVLSAAIDFTAVGVDRKQYMDIEIYLASVDLSAQTNSAIYIWRIARSDDTNFTDGGASVVPAKQPGRIIALRTISGAQREMIERVYTTPDQGKILIQNKTGAALAASGNTVKYHIYGDELV